MPNVTFDATTLSQLNATSTLAGKVGVLNTRFGGGTKVFLRGGSTLASGSLGATPATATVSPQCSLKWLVMTVSVSGQASSATDTVEYRGNGNGALLSGIKLYGSNETAPNPAVQPYEKLTCPISTTAPHAASATQGEFLLSLAGIANNSGLRTFDITSPYANNSRPFWGWPTLIGATPSTQFETEEIVLIGLAGAPGYPTISSLGTQVGSGVQIRKNGGAYGVMVNIIDGDRIQLRRTSDVVGGAVATYLTLNGDGASNLGYAYTDDVWSIRTANNDRAPQTFQVGATRTYTEIQSLATLVRAGDIIEVDDDKEYLPIRFQRDGLANSPITIRKSASATTRPKINGESATFYACWIQAHNYVLESMDIRTHAIGGYNPGSVTAGGPSAAIRNQGHNQTYRDCMLHDAKNSVLSHDDFSGALTLDGCWFERLGGEAVNEALHHGLYVTHNAVKFPDAIVDIIEPQMRNVSCNGIKTRSSRTRISGGMIEMGGYAADYYGVQFVGPNGPFDKNNASGDMLGTVVIMKGTAYAPVFVGGDGNPDDGKQNARVAKCTFIVPDTYSDVEIYCRGNLYSVIGIDNVIIRDGPSTVGIPFTKEYSTTWLGGDVRILSYKSGFPSTPIIRLANGGNQVAIGNGNFVATRSAITSASVSGTLDVSRAAGSPLTGTGTNLTTFTMPAGYELAVPLLTHDFRTSPTRRPWGVAFTRTAGDPAGTNVGAV